MRVLFHSTRAAVFVPDEGKPGFSRIVQQMAVAIHQTKNERMIESHWRNVAAEILWPVGER